MRRNVYYPFLFIIAALFLFLTLPSSITGKLRSVAVGMVSPIWAGFHGEQKQSIDRLQLSLENQRLHEALEEVFEWVLAEEEIQKQQEELEKISEKIQEKSPSRDFFLRRKKELQKRIDLQLQALPAKIIFRDPLSRSHFVWINVGEKENESLGKKIVAVDSPVVVGDCLFGVVEEVEKKRSKVRLITDAGLSVSVRSVRGASQEKVFHQMLGDLGSFLKEKEELFASMEEKEIFLKILLKIQENLSREKREWFLAKGILQGSNLPLWTFGSQKLKGTGFNYDCKDAEGESRDLKTGKSTAGESLEKMALIAAGDLLITSGMDGIFPPGLSVATVCHVFPLKEGATCYDLEAEPLAFDLQDLSVVFVLPPFAGD
jgi:rod shape-determining protein MreC